MRPKINMFNTCHFFIIWNKQTCINWANMQSKEYWHYRSSFGFCSITSVTLGSLKKTTKDVWTFKDTENELNELILKKLVG